MTKQTNFAALALAIVADAPGLNADAAAARRREARANMIDTGTIDAVLASRHARPGSTAVRR